MQVDVQQLEPCKVALNIQVPPERISQIADQVFNRFVRQTTVPGFRKGKAPRKLAERYINVAAVREEAMDKVIQDAYREALKQTGIEPYEQASVELNEFEEGQPLSFTATVPTKPEIELGDYQGIEVRRVVVPMGDGEVSQELQRVREQSARFEEVPEGAVDGDRIQATIQVSVDGVPLPDSSHEHAWLLVGANFPEFDQHLRGIAPDEAREFDFHFPAELEDAERAGKQAHAVVTVEKVQRRIVPGEDDAFAKSIGYDSLEALRADFRKQLETAAEKQADEYVERDIVAEVVKRSTIHFPQSMIDEEVAHRMDALLKGLERRGIGMDDYLVAQKKGLAELEADFGDEARQVITNTLVLSRVAHDNHITVSQTEIDDELKRRAAEAGADPQVMQQVMQDQGEMNRLTNSVFMRKVLDYLKGVAVVKEAS